MMKIKNSDKEEMQRLCNFVRENLEAFGAFHESDCKDVMKQGGEKDDGSYYDWNFTW
mgnify:CR=1 FL=1